MKQAAEIPQDGRDEMSPARTSQMTPRRSHKTQTMETPTPDLSMPEWNKVFKPLLLDLGRRKCILLPGPEAVCPVERAHLGEVEIAPPYL